MNNTFVIMSFIAGVDILSHMFARKTSSRQPQHHAAFSDQNMYTECGIFTMALHCQETYFKLEESARKCDNVLPSVNVWSSPCNASELSLRES